MSATEDANGFYDEQPPAAAEVPPEPPRPVVSACRPDRPNCRPLIIYLPDELFSDYEDGNWGADDSDDSEEDDDAANKPAPPPKRNGQVVVPTDDPVLDRLLQGIALRFEPDQPDLLDRLIAMFNSGKCLGEEGEAQMRRLRAQRRRRQRRRSRRPLEDPNWSPGRRQMRMAECFRSLGQLLLDQSSQSILKAGGGGGGGNGLTGLRHSTQTAVAAVDVSPTPSEVDEGAASLAASTSSSAAEAEEGPPSPPREIRIEITDETLAELGRLRLDGEHHYRRVFLGVTKSPVIYLCPDGPPEVALRRLWLRHCARQSERRRDWELRLADAVDELLERRFAGCLYEPVWCSRLTSLLASDLLELVMHIVGDEFKIVGLLSVGSVTELDSLAMATRSAHCDQIDTCKVFHYQNESVHALFTCHLFQRFDRQLEDAPLEDDEVADDAEAAAADEEEDEDEDSTFDVQQPHDNEDFESLPY